MEKLSVIIPLFNEEKTVLFLLDKVIRQKTEGWVKEIIVIDDGSTDLSREKIKSFVQHSGATLKIIYHPKNMGKGAAIRSGLSAATGDAVLIQDADLEYDPEEWPALLTELNNAEIGAVYGSRNLRLSAESGYWYCSWGVKFLTFCINKLFGGNLTDAYTCYKLIRTRILTNFNITSSKFEIEAELTARILKLGYKIKEIPIHYHPRSYKEGKKIKTIDGLRGFWKILEIRFLNKKIKLKH